MFLCVCTYVFVNDDEGCAVLKVLFAACSECFSPLFNHF